jgi:putative flippase GtrA
MARTGRQVLGAHAALPEVPDRWRYRLSHQSGPPVHQGLLFLLHDSAGLSVPAASPFAILMSMIVTFYLNEVWTWHDRGSGRILHRARTYLPINIGGLAINWGILTYLHESWAVHYLVANLIGAAVAAVWNFSLNNAITWRST